jgi:Cu-Zn family superoxide dismutase
MNDSFYFSLFSERSVYGRTFIVHEKSDDFGQGGDPDSLKTGSAGLRLACGIVTKVI